MLDYDPPGISGHSGCLQDEGVSPTMFAATAPFRKAAARAVALLAMLWLAACDATLPAGLGTGATGNDGPGIAPGQTVQVALLIPQSDPQAGSVARSLENAARMAIAESGADIALTVYDTAGQPEIAAARAREAVDGGAKIILGPLRSETSNAVARAVPDVNVLSFSNTTSIAGGNLFVLGRTFDDIAQRLVGYGVENGVRNIAVLHTADVPGQVGRNAIQTAAVRGGAQIVAAEGYELNTDSLMSALERIEPVVSSGNADGLFLTDGWEAGLAQVFQMAPEAGISPQAVQYMGLTRWDVRPDGFNLPGIEGGIFTMPSRAQQTAFENRYRTRYGSNPNPLAGLAYDGVTAVAALMQDPNRRSLSGDALTRSAGFEGTGGRFRLLDDGTNERALAVATIRNRQVTILDPAPTGFGGAGF